MYLLLLNFIASGTIRPGVPPSSTAAALQSCFEATVRAVSLFAVVERFVILSGVLCREGPMQLAGKYIGPSLRSG
jgi:hypothetical protein